MEAELVLRPARDSDSSGVITLIASVFTEYPGCVLDVDAEEPELRAPATLFERFWVLERGSRIVGCIGLDTHVGASGEPCVELEKLYLANELRGLGWGRGLVELVEGHARERGLPLVELWSDTRFTRAHAVYERLGYRRTGRERDLHDLSNTREYHFEKRLSPGASAPR
jgi:putative acetyltransferase